MIVGMPDGAQVDFGDLPPDQIKGLIASKYPDAISGGGGTDQLAGGDQPAGPWQRYAAPVAVPGPSAGPTVNGGQAGPWTKYAGASGGRLADAEGASKEVPGVGGFIQRSLEREGKIWGNSWPVRAVTGAAKAVVSGATLPGDVYSGKLDTGPVVDEQSYIDRNAALDQEIQRGLDFATIATPTVPEGTGGMMGARGVAEAPAAARVPPTGVPPVVPVTRDELIGAASRQGVEVPRAAASDSMTVQRIGQSVANIPVGGGPMRSAAERAVTQTGEAANRVAAGYGGGAAVSPAGAGATVRTGVENYIGPVLTDRVTKAYDAVDALVSPDVLTPLDSTAKIATEILQRRQAAGLRGAGGAVDLIREAAARPEGLTYTGIKTLRTRVGEMLKGGPLPGDISQGELKQMYGALSEDLRAAVGNAGGPKALAAFERANTYNKLVAERRANLGRILGAKSDEGIYDKIIRTAGSTSTADIKLLAQARKGIPADEWNDIASAAVARMGRGPDGQFSPQRFVTDFSKLSPAGRNVLFRSTGNKELADALDDIATISSRFQSLQRFANPSGTAQNIIGVGQVMTGISSAFVHPLLPIATTVGPNLLARILAKPATARAVASYERAYTTYALKPTRLTMQALSFASRRLAIEIGQEFQLSGPIVNQFAQDFEGGASNTEAQPK